MVVIAVAQAAAPSPGHILPESFWLTTVGLLCAALIAMAGLWVRAHDQHRHWSTGKITDHEKDIALVKHDYSAIREDLSEIKGMITDHVKQDRMVQAALVRKLGLQISPSGHEGG